MIYYSSPVPVAPIDARNCKKFLGYPIKNTLIVQLNGAADIDWRPRYVIGRLINPSVPRRRPFTYTSQSGGSAGASVSEVFDKKIYSASETFCYD
jgi:hypothetical protein